MAEIMRANPEFLLLTMIIEERRMREALASGVRADHFGSPQTQSAFSYLLDHYKEGSTTGTIPSPRTFAQRFPWYQPMPVLGETTVRSISEEVVTEALKREVATQVHSLGTSDITSVEDVEVVIQTLRELVARHKKIDSAVSCDKESLATVIDWYNRAKKKELLSGLPYPWVDLNIETQGIQEHDFILYFGRPKNGKSWMLVETAMNLLQHLPDGSKILFATFEMDLQRLMNRLACLKARVDYRAFNHGELGDVEREKLNKALRELYEDKKRGKGIIFTGPAIKASSRKGFSMLDIEQSAEEIKPRAIFIDGLLHAADVRTGKRSREWNIISNLSSDAKQMALRLHCPVIATHQANRESEKSIPIDTQRDIAYSDALGQDTDMSLRISLIRMPGTGEKRYFIQPAGMREFDMTGFLTMADFCTNLNFVRTVGRHEVKKLLAREIDEERKTKETVSKRDGMSVATKRIKDVPLGLEDEEPESTELDQEEAAG